MVPPLLKLVSACGLLTLAATTAFAQSSPCTQASKYGLLASAPASLAGCPLSAVIQTETTQSLADGTRIQKKFKNLVYRDSAGRIRYEFYAPTNPDKDFPAASNMIYIFDPVAGFSYLLWPETARGSRHRIGEPPPSSAAPSATAQHEESEATVENLGTMWLEGLLVKGRRITHTIPEGAEGNDRALTVVVEAWESSEMGITLLQKNSDPRSGNSTKRMTNLKRTEPDSALFQVPTDYTVKDE
ncbi:MAG: hypothetical protein WBR26_25770 [Candidatus Acidiferrum sp.]